VFVVILGERQRPKDLLLANAVHRSRSFGRYAPSG
jgi:hypothetical protein